MLHDILYHKIPGPFRRESTGPNKNKVIPWAWTSPELEYLAGTPWDFYEKIDGTNIRGIWDGHNLEYRGRTNNTQIPPKLLDALQTILPEDLVEQKFGPQPAILFGEGYGAGIQKGGGNYIRENKFILFDVLIDRWWLAKNDVREIANSLGIDTVPKSYQGTLREAIYAMSKYEVFSAMAETPNTRAEGWVGIPSVPLYARDGSRIIVKIKDRDLHGLDLTAGSEGAKLNP